MAATRDALAERLQGIRETASLLYNRMMENMEYGQERLKEIVEKEGKEEEKEQQQEPVAAKEEEEAEEQQQGPSTARTINSKDWQHKMMMMSDMIPLEK